MSIKSALRTLSSKEATIEEIGEFQRQIDHETNDRGAAILMATNVELALNRAVFRVLEWDQETYAQLTSEEGPAGSFSQKIHLGRALRIYGKDTQHNLDYIRLIRNAFAHSHAPISFETKEVKDAVAILKQVPPLPPLGVAGLASAGIEITEKTSRDDFRRTCDITAHNLLTWAFFLNVGGVLQDTPRSDELLQYLWRKPLP
jgi:hypothetical protein